MSTGRPAPTAGPVARMLCGAGVLAVALLVVGCGAGQEGEGEAGMGLPQQLDGQTYPGTRSKVTGETVVADNGCFLVRSDGIERLAIWPRGSRDDGAVLYTPAGEQVGQGTQIHGVGTVLAVSHLVAMDGYWDHVTGFCVPGAEDVLVLDEVTTAG